MAKHDKQTNLQFVTELLIHVLVQQKLHFVHLNTCEILRDRNNSKSLELHKKTCETEKIMESHVISK